MIAASVGAPNGNPMTRQDLLRLMRFYYDITPPFVEIAKEKGWDPVHWLKHLALCQTSFQERYGRRCMGRTVHLFTKEKCSYPIADRFAQLTGIGVQDFFDGCMILYIISHQFIRINTASTDIDLPVMEQSSWQKFLDCISLYPKDYDLTLETHDPESQLYEQFGKPILERYPAVRVSPNEIIIPWPEFVGARFCQGVYDILKEHDGYDFAREFGTTLQTYIEKLFRASLIPNDLTAFRCDRNFDTSLPQPDFAIHHADTLYCIEIKATEYALSVELPHLIDAYERTIGRGVAQCSDFWSAYKQGLAKCLPDGLTRCVPIIVTWGRFHFANHETFRTQAIPDSVPDEIRQAYQVIALPDLEELLALLLEAQIPFADPVEEKLNDGVRNEWTGVTGHFMNEHGITAKSLEIPGLTSDYDTLIDDMERRMRESTPKD